MAILKGSQRGGARDLALHLVKPENEHIELHEVRGFVSNSIMGALTEAYAMSKATKCKKFLYSLSANPPPDQQVTTEDFIEFIDRSEAQLGLSGQARIIVFHEKHGRRHAHCVWSRIQTDSLTAVHISYDKKKLVALTRDIFLERNWPMPDGLAHQSFGHPRNFTLAQWQQAKRRGKDPKAIKRALQDAWAISDSKAALINALDERGFKLARGDRKFFVVIDHNLEVYSLPRWAGQKTKLVKERLGEPDTLPSVDETKEIIRAQMQEGLTHLQNDTERRSQAAQVRFEARLKSLIKKQRVERVALKKAHTAQHHAANKARAARFRRGLGALWDYVRGEHKRIQKQNEYEAYQELKRQRATMDDLILRHLKERRQIEMFKLRYTSKAQAVVRGLQQERSRYMAPEI